MQEVAELLNVMGTINECFWIYCIMDILFGQRIAIARIFKSKWVVIWLNVVCAAITILIMNHQTLTSPWTLTVWILYGVASACIFFDVDVLRAIAVVGTYCLGLLVIGMIEISITGLIGGDELIKLTTIQNGIYRVLYLMCGVPIWGILNIFFCRWLKRKIPFQNNHKYWMYMSIIGIIGGAFIASQMLFNFSVEINIISFLFVTILIMLVYGMVLWTKNKAYKKQMNSLERNNELLEKGYKQISRTYSENAKLYHDMSHHLNVIYRLVKQEDIKNAEQYLESILLPGDTDVVVNRTGIELINVIFHEMHIKAQERNVKLSFDVQQLPQDIIISQKDLCGLFVNLLENAIEAARSNVYVKVKQIHKMLFVQIKNDYITQPKIKDGKFQTTKVNSEKHGWGMQIIEQVVLKYDGNIKYLIDENYVNIETMLNDIE